MAHRCNKSSASCGKTYDIQLSGLIAGVCDMFNLGAHVTQMLPKVRYVFADLLDRIVAYGASQFVLDITRLMVDPAEVTIARGDSTSYHLDGAVRAELPEGGELNRKQRRLLESMKKAVTPLSLRVDTHVTTTRTTLRSISLPCVHALRSAISLW